MLNKVACLNKLNLDLISVVFFAVENIYPKPNI